MLEKIVPGDLVQIIKPTLCCNSDNAIGEVFTVADISTEGVARCQACGAFGLSNDTTYLHLGDGIVHRKRVKKLDAPFDESYIEEIRQLERIQHIPNPLLA